MPLQVELDALLYVPCGHVKHAMEPSCLTEYCPAGHATQALNPGLGLKVPGGHSEHAVALAVALNGPDGHGNPVGELQPTAQMYPGTDEHALQFALPMALVYVPAGQGRQATSPLLLYLPTGHGPPQEDELYPATIGGDRKGQASCSQQRSTEESALRRAYYPEEVFASS